MHVSRAFLVAKHSGGYRLVIDLRHVNSHFDAPVVKFESLANLKMAPQAVHYATSIGVSDAYHHLRLSDNIAHYF